MCLPHFLSILDFWYHETFPPHLVLSPFQSWIQLLFHGALSFFSGEWHLCTHTHAYTHIYIYFYICLQILKMLNSQWPFPFQYNTTRVSLIFSLSIVLTLLSNSKNLTSYYPKYTYLSKTLVYNQSPILTTTPPSHRCPPIHSVFEALCWATHMGLLHTHTYHGEVHP